MNEKKKLDTKSGSNYNGRIDSQRKRKMKLRDEDGDNNKQTEKINSKKKNSR